MNKYEQAVEEAEKEYDDILEKVENDPLVKAAEEKLEQAQAEYELARSKADIKYGAHKALDKLYAAIEDEMDYRNSIKPVSDL